MVVRTATLSAKSTWALGLTLVGRNVNQLRRAIPSRRRGSY